MHRSFYSDSIAGFLSSSPTAILGLLTEASPYSVEVTQRDAWLEQIRLLKEALGTHHGSIYFEYSIPRMGRRIDTVLLIGPVIFVLEFKVGEDAFPAYATDQVTDYSLDLKNFHESSHDQIVAPLLIATKAASTPKLVLSIPHGDKLLAPIKTNAASLSKTISAVLQFAEGKTIDRAQWEAGRYSPTPTIIEAAVALYSGHLVEDISRRDADAINLHDTSQAISEIIRVSKEKSRKAICFVTGVPGAGKTLVGLDIATKHMDKTTTLYSVFLSGNGPLVTILREALVRDKVAREKTQGRRWTKLKAFGEVKAFIQNVHNFRDECLTDDAPPPEHVALFDEAQRAWNLQQTSYFMRRKKNKPGFNQSEPEFLISCMDRHEDWAVIVCLVGGGQEINTGEAGITEWIESLQRSFKHWDIYISPRLTDSEYAAKTMLKAIETRPNVNYSDNLHLSVSMRSFRAEKVSLLVKQLLDLDADDAKRTYASIGGKYPIALTRNLSRARAWIRDHARGTERYGIVASSQAERLKPHAINVKAPLNPVHWFLDGKQDVRSSYYLEDAATEFHVQGLELDWTCVTWDADFRHDPKGWEHRSFFGKSWKHIRKAERQNFLKNAYRVLLTRARQGMVICVPEGEAADPTRKAEFYDPTFIVIV